MTHIQFDILGKTFHFHLESVAYVFHLHMKPLGNNINTKFGSITVCDVAIPLSKS